MSLSWTEDYKTLEELAADAPGIVQQIHHTGRPVVVTVNGKPNVVMMDAATAEQRLKLVNLSALLAEGEADIRAGRTRPVAEFAREFRRAKKISSADHGRRRTRRG